MTRSEKRYAIGGFFTVSAWLMALVMGAASVDRASYEACIDAGGDTTYCSQGYEPYHQSLEAHQ